MCHELVFTLVLLYFYKGFFFLVLTLRGIKLSFQVTSSTLEVDFGALAVALKSIPLHRRLDISPDYVHVSIPVYVPFNLLWLLF